MNKRKQLIILTLLIYACGIIRITAGETNYITNRNGVKIASTTKGRDGNIIINPGLELPGKLIWDGTSALCERSSTQVHSGSWSLHIKDENKTSCGYASSLPTLVPLQGGGRFYAEAWIKIDSRATKRTGYGSASVEVVFYRNDGKFLVAQNVGRISSAKKWHRVCNLVTLPYEAAKIGFRITPAAHIKELMANVYVDDLYLAPLPVAEAVGRVKLLPQPKPPRGAPEYKVTKRSDDGRNLALTIKKLSEGFDPKRPFVIWAIGSSFTDFLGNGDKLIAAIHKKYPNAPEIVYKKMIGGSTPYNLLRGWARHLVIPDHPDLVLTYNFGYTANMEKLFIELRSKTTADIIVGSLHWCKNHKKAWPNPETPVRKYINPKKLRELCKRYKVEFVENRQDVTAYMTANKLTIKDMLVDSVHQSPYLAKMINANIARHFNHPAKFSYDPGSRERRVEAEKKSAKLKTTGSWVPAKKGQALSATGSGSEMIVDFNGNRIELIGWLDPQGGELSVWIDGIPAQKAEAYYASYIQPGEDNFINLDSRAVDFRRMISDRCPHGVSLGQNIIPQKWEIIMTSDKGDYKLTGSVTDFDGKGNAFKPFTSKSGQIIIDPVLWRLAKTNRSGDKFSFEVKRSAREKIDFKGKAGRFRVCVLDNLSNGPHQLRLKTQGGGPVTIDAFDIFEPPLKRIQK